MQAAAHDAKFAKEAGIPQSVAKEFNEADKRRASIAKAITAAKSRRAK
jgi:hypothetical protein